MHALIPLYLGGRLASFTLQGLGIHQSQNQYMYWDNLCHLNHPLSPSLSTGPLRWPPCPSLVDIHCLVFFLVNHPHHKFCNFVLQGLSAGFHIDYQCNGPPLCSRGGNHSSSQVGCQKVVSAYIQEEIEAGRMVNPVSGTVLDHIHCSQVGLVPKGQGSGRWRMIVDLSLPPRSSVNDSILEDDCSVKYSSVDNAVQLITMLGRHTVFITIDLKSAYRFVPIHPADRHLLGIRWEGNVYVDQALPFGLRSAPIIFTAVADVIRFALMQGGVPILIHYLDDFFNFLCVQGCQIGRC